ncbi:basic helix loop helix (bHLH) DNA-binding superfamily protein, putative [Medicago truncatula]|uniref:Basic helix loop helix (BHLH) DNA-binding superfamily protein, putative n=1 Tax=Medicago truncatula TaxID=3880 RepID=G7LGQ2_MEDTR|nr:basic helix loop helix (bHLH) DNA-binding superfamily protein, putative [Medicago truncatula]
MLCFGNYQNEIDETTNVILTPQKSIITSSDSSSASSCNHQTNTGFNSLTTLGERIAALQHVSPFGKTDTASVLHEATGYMIKFRFCALHACNLDKFNFKIFFIY